MTAKEASPREGNEGSGTDRSTNQLPATLSIFVDDGPLSLDAYPNAEGAVALHTYSEGTVTIGVSSDGAEAALTFTPDGAERAAELLEEFAAKAREGTDWVYP